ncbi:MAG: HNH endonuclease [Clostridium perfringens]|uniref:HNH endonuclease n=1 Tax=Clostridium perfringens TaxID=1502 RepID=UPI00112C13D5|nr:HNH endonuclease [Clostridium perfringens]TPG02852.1 hypothetical protein XA71_05440 [Clostridium perfringens A]
MISLKKPEDSVKDVFTKCIGNIRDEKLKEKLNFCLPSIVNITDEYEDKAKEGLLYQIEEHDNICGLVTTNEMKKIYTDKFAKNGQPGRKYYDIYMTIPKYGTCPFCGQRKVSTIDHFLAKTKFPSLAVSPINLVPACQDCNKIKGDKSFKSIEEQILHPYFDNIDSEEWLVAKIIKGSEITIIFEIRCPENGDEILYKRIKKHFDDFKLNILYSSHAAGELVSSFFTFQMMYNVKGSQGLKEYLDIVYKSKKMARVNSWETAMYKALSESEWFCSEGIEIMKRELCLSR